MPEASAGPAGVFYRLFNMSLLVPRRVGGVCGLFFAADRRRSVFAADEHLKKNGGERWRRIWARATAATG